jgi:formate-dependent nitrite reductase membrane component NrfD
MAPQTPFQTGQSRGVGAHAGKQNADALTIDPKIWLDEKSPDADTKGDRQRGGVTVLDQPDKGILWGRKVSAYVVTKSFAAGIPILIGTAAIAGVSLAHLPLLYSIAFVALCVTGFLLANDLKRPERFLYVLLRPQWGSWLVRGGVILAVHGGLLTAGLICSLMEPSAIGDWIAYALIPSGAMTAIYTAFLLGQCRARDFWQSPLLAVHLFLHAVTAGAAILVLLDIAAAFAAPVLVGSLAMSLISTIIDIVFPHGTRDSKWVAKRLRSGPESTAFWLGAIVVGHLLPLVLVLVAPAGAMWAAPPVAWAATAGLWFVSDLWIRTPQKVRLA